MSFTIEVTGFQFREDARVLAEKLARNAPPSLSVRIVPGDADERDRTIETLHPVPTEEIVVERTERTVEDPDDAEQE